VQISDWTVISLLVVVAINTVFIAALAILLFAVNRKVNEALDKATPVLERATSTLARVEETTVQLQQRVDHVLDKTTELVDQISERVDTTTAIAEEAVTEPLIGAASIMAGINRGFQVYTERASEKGDGR
jgi:uncharacterized protein YoxC